MSKNSKEEFFQNKTALAISLILLGFILIFGKPPKNNLSNHTFENEPVKVEGFSLEESKDAQLPKRIIIPELSINLNVAKAKIINGYWEVFSESAGWGEGSGVPGQAGNQVIFAHAREGLFWRLKEIEEGMNVYVLTSDSSLLPNGEDQKKSWYSYRVTEIKEVLPQNIEVIAETEDETLTLYTCSGYNDSKRLIVTAKRN